MESKIEKPIDGSKFSGIQVGVLAIQGSFREHIAALRKCGAECVTVRRPEDLVGCTGLIIPGGESTTMANVATRNGLISVLKDFQASGKPIWGTCAGLIFLAERALGQKMGGQALLGGLDCTVHRNFFGSQVNSFVADLPAPVDLIRNGGEETFPAVFIRAPAILQTGPEVEVLAEYRITPKSSPSPDTQIDKVVVAARQGHILVTAFHPELTNDLRWHLMFLEMVANHSQQRLGNGEDNIATDLKSTSKSSETSKRELIIRPVNDPGDLPVFLP